MSEERTAPSRFIGLDVHKYYLIAVGVDAQLHEVYGPVHVPLANLRPWVQKNLTHEDAAVLEMTTNVISSPPHQSSVSGSRATGPLQGRTSPETRSCAKPTTSGLGSRTAPQTPAHRARSDYRPAHRLGLVVDAWTNRLPNGRGNSAVLPAWLNQCASLQFPRPMTVNYGDDEPYSERHKCWD
jgi:hypothetical protein